MPLSLDLNRNQLSENKLSKPLCRPLFDVRKTFAKY